MEIVDIIRPALLILIPALNVLGIWLKGTKGTNADGTVSYPNQRVKSKNIPLILLIIAILFCIVSNLVNADLMGWRLILNALTVGSIEGLVCTGVSVLGYDIIKGKAKTK